MKGSTESEMRITKFITLKLKRTILKKDNAERNFKIRTPNPKPSAKMTFNQDQLR